MSQVRYHPLGPLLSGEGSRAFLGLALEDTRPPRPVVLVWAPPEVARDAELLEALQRETQRASVLEHPNILRVHGLIQLEAGLARITEFADGESLRRLLEVRPRIPPAYAALIAAEVAMGIHYAHLAGNDDGTPMVHGDLRPETVMVSFEGLCKVAGYGALSVAPRERNGRRVRNRRNYSAPEQLVGGREAFTPRTDVFLLGLLLHECLSGRMPFQDSPDADQAVLNRPLAPLPGDVPRALSEVIARATAKRALDRHATALEFRDAVVRAVEGVIPPSSAFADFLNQLFPPERDARATRHQMLEMGLSEVSRRTSITGLPAIASGTPLVPRTFDGKPRVAPEATDGVDVDVSFEVPFEDTDANAVDSVLEITGRHARPGVAKPLPREEAPAPRQAAPPEEDELPVVPPRRSRMPLIAGLGAVAATLAGAFLWFGQMPAPKPQAALPVLTTKPAPKASPPPAVTPPTAPPETALAAASADDAGTPSAQDPAPTAVAAAAPDDGGTPSVAPGATVAAVGTEPAAAHAVKLASGTLPAEPAPAPAAEVTTRLKLFVLPPVEVSLAGKVLGKTPLTVPLAPGPYTLELSNAAKGLRTQREVTVGPKAITTQRMLLGRGSVQVKAPAGAVILVNGRKAVGKTLSLWEGEHQLVVTSPKGRWEKTFQLAARQKMTFDVTSEQP
ncbi:serine/threonine protein kinase [Archangium primigenium]|uniref:serine/threonine protein kinase n=1 Tax=[Archangium] primigenium TaxID=2792470 RepID=UPI00195E978E|nr:serine/threonine-protein kinase [Archangium primigenium]MBM7115792.1 serine/threonine protein kinase [Archangium primigenium]